VDDRHGLLANWSFGAGLGRRVIRGTERLHLTAVPTAGP
jgi:hypothetical protein